MLRRAFNGQDQEVSVPPHLLGNFPGPFQFAERRLLADVVYTSRSPFIRSNQRKRRGDVLDIASGRAPRRQRLRKNDVTPSVSDALHHWIKTMQWVAGSVHHGQADYRARQVGIGHHYALGRNLVVIVGYPREDLA